MNLKYVKGDATDPPVGGKQMIIHCCNNVGAWGRGFVMALSAKCTAPERAYRNWAKGNELIPFQLGQVQFVPYRGDPNLIVCNMIGQSGIGGFAVDELPPIRYEAIHECLIRVRDAILREPDNGKGCSIHCPRFGAGLAGGSWDKIEEIIVKVFKDTDISITVYDL